MLNTSTPTLVTFTVTHPDGTTSTRPSASLYTHAVVCHVFDPEVLAESHDAEVRKLDRHAGWHATEADRVRTAAVEHPDGWYVVMRWTKGFDVAQRAATGELRAIMLPGQTVYVQPIDA